MITIKRAVTTFMVCAALSTILGCGGGGGSAVAPTSVDISRYQTVAGVPSLVIGTPTISGTVATFPLSFSAQGKSVVGIDTVISFKSDVFALIMNGTAVDSASAGAAATEAGKQINQSKSATQSDVLRIAIIDLGGKKAIADGVIAYIRLSLASGSLPGSYAFTIVPTATDANAAPTVITGTN